MNYIAFLCFAAVLPLLFLFFKKCIKLKDNKILKIASLTLAAIFFVRLFSKAGSLFSKCLNLTYNNPFSSSFLCFVVVILVWLSFASVVILTLMPFFEFDTFKNYARSFCLVVNFLDAIFLQQIAYSFTGTYDVSLCGIFLALEIALSLGICIYTLLISGKFTYTKENVLDMLKVLPVILLTSIPPYLLNTLFGTVGFNLVKGFTLYHRLYLYIAILFLFGVYFALRKRSKNFIRMMLLYISLVTLISYCYNYDFSWFITPTSWPLHLCNTAMIIIPICLIFRLDKLFYFTLFINVLGAFLAMLMPNYNEYSAAFSPDVVKFWINHIIAFAMPILIVILGVYRRPNLKLFLYSLVGFAIYFMFVLIINAWFTNYDMDVDFFFLNSDFIAEKLGTWAENTRNIMWSFSLGGLTFTFYPLYQFLFFIVYTILGLAMWFVYAVIFQIQDFYIMLNSKRQKIKIDEIAMCVKYQKKEINECMNQESVNKLVVKNLSKRYGNNKFYSVKDASFEVEAGEILGFLGPNGAGKSTIIKCIVGIQPQTEGSIEINGYDTQSQSVLAKAQFGFVPDHYALYEKLTGREYINYMADLYGVDKETRDKRLTGLLKNLSMEANIDNQIRTYSHGMKQKITIMSALIHDPKLWILDEPLTGLDPNSIYEVKECMKNHAKKGNIVFFSSHIIDIVEKLCDRIIIIKHGKIVTTITLEELKQKNISLEKFYLDIINTKDDNSDMRYIKPKDVKEKLESKFFENKDKKKQKHKAIKNQNLADKKTKETDNPSGTTRQ